jgi:hypothetical protein
MVAHAVCYPIPGHRIGMDKSSSRHALVYSGADQDSLLCRVLWSIATSKALTRFP